MKKSDFIEQTRDLVPGDMLEVRTNDFTGYNNTIPNADIRLCVFLAVEMPKIHLKDPKAVENSNKVWEIHYTRITSIEKKEKVSADRQWSLVNAPTHKPTKKATIIHVGFKPENTETKIIPSSNELIIRLDNRIEVNLEFENKQDMKGFIKQLEMEVDQAYEDN